MVARRKKVQADDPQIIDASEDELNSLCQRAKRKELTDADADLLEQIVKAYVYVLALVRMKRTTIARLRRLFGLHTSEKTADVLSDVEGGNANAKDGDASSTESETASADAENGTLSADKADKKRKPGHGRNGVDDYPGAEQTVVVHETLKRGDRCPENCGGKVYPMAKPKSVIRVYGRSPIAAHVCSLQRLRCNGCQKIFTAKTPPQFAGKKKYDESAAATIAVMHYALGATFYRLEQLQQCQKVPLPAATQWQIVNDAYPLLMPVFNELVTMAANGQVLHNDDTTARILSLMGKRREKKIKAGTFDKPERTGLFTTGIVGKNANRTIALFYSGRHHAGENIAKVLAKRNQDLGPPIQMSDGLAANVCHMFEVIQANCLVHGRRLWVDQIANFPAECAHLLETLALVFQNEKTCKALSLNDDERLAYHQQHSKKLLDDLKEWIDSLFRDKKIEPNSSLAEAINYMNKRWDKLTLFLTVPGAPIQNNIVERALKKAIILRKNSLFYKTEHGANVGALYTTLIYNADINDANPLDYLTQLMRHPDLVAKNPAAWMPWNYTDALTLAAAPA